MLPDSRTPQESIPKLKAVSNTYLMAGKTLLAAMVVAFVVAVQAFPKETIVEKGNAAELPHDTKDYSTTGEEYDAGESPAEQRVIIGYVRLSSPAKLLNKSPMRLLPDDYCYVPDRSCEEDSDCIFYPFCNCNAGDITVPIPIGRCFNPSMY